MPKYSDKQIADGLRASRGMVYVAARQMGCSGNTIKARLAKSEKLREIQAAESEIVLDSAELKLGQAMMRGEAWAIKFLLSTKGKSRGYVERVEQEITGAERGPVEIIIGGNDGSATDTGEDTP